MCDDLGGNSGGVDNLGGRKYCFCLSSFVQRIAVVPELSNLDFFFVFTYSS